MASLSFDVWLDGLMTYCPMASESYAVWLHGLMLYGFIFLTLADNDDAFLFSV